MFRKRKLITEIREGEEIEDVFVVKIKRGLKEYSNGFFIDLVLSDSTGKTIGLKYWGSNNLPEMKGLYDSITEDSIILVRGKVGKYRNHLEISTSEKPRILEEGEYDPMDFIKPARGNLGEKYAKIMEYVDMISDEKLAAMVREMIESKKDRFMKYPAAIEIHHNWIGGLMDHILEMLRICEVAWNMYGLDKDLLIAGCVLHDIGKLEELYMTTRIKGSRIGQLVGHIILGAMELGKWMDEFGIEGMMREKLLHLIASHHGSLDKGSPREPMFPEAIVLHEADELSSRVAEFQEFIKYSREETENDFMYNRRHGRNILLK